MERFCENCGEKTEYTIRKRLTSCDFRGEFYTYAEDYALCDACGEPVFVPEIHDHNIDQRLEIERSLKSRKEQFESMKLLFCPKCGDIFNLTYETKVCRCGETGGRYIDRVKAVYSGDSAVPLGFDNGSFLNALAHQPQSGDGYTFNAFVIPVECPTFKKEKGHAV